MKPNSYNTHTCRSSACLAWAILSLATAACTSTETGNPIIEKPAFELEAFAFSSDSARASFAPSEGALRVQRLLINVEAVDVRYGPQCDDPQVMSLPGGELDLITGAGLGTVRLDPSQLCSIEFKPTAAGAGVEKSFKGYSILLDGRTSDGTFLRIASRTTSPIRVETANGFATSAGRIEVRFDIAAWLKDIAVDTLARQDSGIFINDESNASVLRALERKLPRAATVTAEGGAQEPPQPAQQLGQLELLPASSSTSLEVGTDQAVTFTLRNRSDLSLPAVTVTIALNAPSTTEASAELDGVACPREDGVWICRIQDVGAQASLVGEVSLLSEVTGDYAISVTGRALADEVWSAAPLSLSGAFVEAQEQPETAWSTLPSLGSPDAIPVVGGRAFVSDNYLYHFGGYLAQPGVSFDTEVAASSATKSALVSVSTERIDSDGSFSEWRTTEIPLPVAMAEFDLVPYRGEFLLFWGETGSPTFAIDAIVSIGGTNSITSPSRRSELSLSRYQHEVVYGSGRAYVLGGRFGGTGIVNAPVSVSLERAADTSTIDDWIIEPEMPSNRTQVAAAYFQGHVYVLGGITVGGDVLDEVFVYDVQSDGRLEPSTSTFPAMPLPLRQHRAWIYFDRLVVAGGRSDNDEVSDRMFSAQIDLTTGELGQWEEEEAMPKALYEFADAQAVAGDAVRWYIIGGLDATNQPSSEVLAYAQPL